MVFLGLRELIDLKRLLKLARIKELVEKLYHLLGPELDHAHACAHQALLNHGDALLELCAVLLELLVGDRGAVAVAGAGQEIAEAAQAPPRDMIAGS